MRAYGIREQSDIDWAGGCCVMHDYRYESVYACTFTCMHGDVYACASSQVAPNPGSKQVLTSASLCEMTLTRIQRNMVLEPVIKRFRHRA
jgi:hypothetical protein